MDKPYQPHTLEAAAQTHWQQTKQHEAQEQIDKPPFYCLSMLPYPSGQLHMGHVRNYTIGDAISRQKKMEGFNVLQPIGWDAFGLPAENAAIKNGTSPAAWTYDNIDHMKKQLASLGLAYDWQRELTTCKPEYYKWNQWLFLQMYKRGLAYQKTSAVNWDPVDNTVLANEQVVDGKGWRSGAPVERKMLRQWFFRIKSYAESLLSDLEQLPDWPKQVKRMQKNWIGHQSGTAVRFALKDHTDQPIEVFTTRVDTLFGVGYLVLAPEHPLAVQAGSMDPKIKAFIEQTQQQQTSEAAMATAEKKGIATPYIAIHPLTGKELPIWIGNFVVMDYGSGAVMAVAAHDARDHAFAKKYDLPILPVIKPTDTWSFDAAAYVEKEGTLMHSDAFDGMDCTEATKAITQALEAKEAGQPKTQYRLRDWGISRQRYWGTPIPMIHCNDCGCIPVPEEDLPVLLPENLVPQKHNVLLDFDAFVNTTCPQCQGPAKRETDTMDTFVDSSWYFLRYTCFDQNHAILDDRAHYWMPVNQYVGGVEHAILHLLYARFVHKVIKDLKYVHADEPFLRLLTQGMVLNDGQKMSKSKGNTVSPAPIIEKYGADTVRLFILFAAPPEQSMEWSQGGIDGAHRFLNKLWSAAHSWKALLNKTANTLSDKHPKERLALHQHLKQALFDYERQQFNTVVSAAMKILTLIQQLPIEAEHAPFVKEALPILLRLLGPITPHITDVMWREMGFGQALFSDGWLQVDTKALVCDTIEWVVQINGKMRGRIEAALDANAEELLAQCQSDEKLACHLADKTIRKTIVVPKKLVNIVL